MKIRIEAVSSRLKIAHRLTVPVVVLAAIAAAIGLFLPAVYRETEWVVPQNRGQDLVTLLVLAALIPALIASHRGSPRGTLVWLGLVGYLAYTYTGAAFAYGFNKLFPIYVALFALTGAALLAGMFGLDVAALRSAFDDGAPRRGVIAFLLIMALVLCALWGSQIVPFYTDGRLPETIVRANTPTVFVYVLDLGVVAPVSLLSAWWLWRDAPWGYVLAGFVLVKAATMGLALLSMTAFAMRAQLQVDAVLSVAWGTLALAGLLMSAWYFSHCGRPQRASPGSVGRAVRA